VGQPTPGQSDPNAPTYATAQEKYKKALEQFDAILNKYTMVPRPKAVAIARYQAGMCQSLLDDHAGAVQTLTEASQDHDAEIASLAKFALAGELMKSGKTPEAAKLYQELADHPTLNVPKASALLALAVLHPDDYPALFPEPRSSPKRAYSAQCVARSAGRRRSTGSACANSISSRFHAGNRAAPQLGSSENVRCRAGTGRPVNNRPITGQWRPRCNRFCQRRATDEME